MVNLYYTSEGRKILKDALDFKWVTRCELGRVTETKLSNPKIGDTLILDPYTSPQPFQTKPIISISKNSDTKVIFKTEEKEYEFFTHLYFQSLYEKLDL